MKHPDAKGDRPLKLLCIRDCNKVQIPKHIKRLKEQFKTSKSESDQIIKRL